MKNNLTKKILLTLTVSGAIVIAATSPYFLVNLARRYFRYSEYDKRKITKTISRLNKNRFIILRKAGDNIIIKLTEKGRSRVKKYQLKDLAIKKPESWDKKWRLVMFDIPDKKRARDTLRWKLKEMGFCQLQKSVWVFPYPCEEEIGFLTDFFEINQNIKIATADKIFEDKELKEYFKLR